MTVQELSEMRQALRVALPIFLLIAIIASVKADFTKEGEVEAEFVTLPTKSMAYVKNQQQMYNAERAFDYGQVCELQAGGTLTVIEKDERPETLLVEYGVRGEQSGNNCPYGVIFLLRQDIFSGLAEK